MVRARSFVDACIPKRKKESQARPPEEAISPSRSYQAARQSRVSQETEGDRGGIFSPGKKGRRWRKASCPVVHTEQSTANRRLRERVRVGFGRTVRPAGASAASSWSERALLVFGTPRRLSRSTTARSVPTNNILLLFISCVDIVCPASILICCLAAVEARIVEAIAVVGGTSGSGLGVDLSAHARTTPPGHGAGGGESALPPEAEGTCVCRTHPRSGKGDVLQCSM